MANLSDPYISPETYLAQERAAQFRSEYWDGRVYPLSEGSEHHCLIAMNLRASLCQQLEGGSARAQGAAGGAFPDGRSGAAPGTQVTEPVGAERIQADNESASGTNRAVSAAACRAYGSDVRIATSTGKRYFHPDLSVICGPTEFHDEHKDTATNPTVIFEVLSESTAAHDRGPKFLSYQGIATLQEYLLVHSDEPIIEHYLRRPDDTWIYQLVEGLTASLILTSIRCSLNLEEVYLSVFSSDHSGDT